MTSVVELGTGFDLLLVQRQNPQRYPFFLSSGAASEYRQFAGARFDILCAMPSASLSLYPNGLWATRGAYLQNRAYKLQETDFLACLTKWQQQLQASSQTKAALAFSGGFFVYFAYEFAQFLEKSLQLNIGSQQLLARAVRVANVLVLDRQQNKVLLLQEPKQGAQGVAIKQQILADVKAAQVAQSLPQTIAARQIIEEDGAIYLNKIAKVKEYIGAGDVYQVNLSRRWDIELFDKTTTCSDIFAALRYNNPSPFAALANFGDMSIISSSPERLVKLSHNILETRPIAGTKFAGAEAYQLNRDPKERAEHIMLVDLERNDLAKVAEIGSVRVDELLVLERYRHVEHLVSNVCARKRANASSADILAALFPGGTITGCPKLRCMQILAELETAPRAAYTGSLGYINLDGSMDLNILIRTLERHGANLCCRAGGGIVFDSQRDKELAETRAKARAMLAVFDVRN